MTEPKIVHRTIRVVGQVQGVFYRQSTKQQANQLGLAGYARNESDGSVRIEVEGDLEAIERLIDWCQDGPPAARVERVTVDVGSGMGFEGFKTM